MDLKHPEKIGDDFRGKEAKEKNQFENLARALESFSEQEVNITQGEAKAILALFFGLIALVAYAITQGGRVPIVIDNGVWGYINETPGSIKDFIRSPSGQMLIKEGVNTSGKGDEFSANLAEFQRLYDLRGLWGVFFPSLLSMLSLITILEKNRGEVLRVSTTVVPAAAKLLRVMGRQK